MSAAEWALLAACGVAIGLAKTSIAGLGTLAVVGFALVLPARQSTGVLLPLLIAADVMAITVYRRDAVWSLLRRLALWVALGILLGAAYLARADDTLMRPTIGVLVLVGVVVSVVSLPRRQVVDGDGDPPPARPALAAAVGVAAGFASMVANAAGPLMTLYLLYAGLPVRRFVGTAAWFFFVVNLAKSPFSAGLGLLDGEALRITSLLLPTLAVGAFAGVRIVRVIPQALFERIALTMVAVAAIPLLL